MALSLEQFSELRKKGLSTDQIIRFDKDTTKRETIAKSQAEAQRYANESGTGALIGNTLKGIRPWTREGLSNIGQGIVNVGKAIVNPIDTAKKVGGVVKDLATSSAQDTAYNLFYQKGLDKQNLQTIQDNNKKVLELNEAIKATQNESEKEKLKRHAKIYLEFNQRLAEETGGELKDKTNLQLAGQSLGTALDLTPFLGVGSLGTKLGLKTLEKVGVKSAGKILGRTVPKTGAELTKEAIAEGGLYGGLSGFGAGIEQKDPTLKSVGLSTALGTGLGAGAGGVLSKVLSRLGAKAPRLEKKIESGEVTEKEIEDIFNDSGIDGVEEIIKPEPVKLKAGEFAPIAKEIQETTGKKLTAKETLEVKDKIEKGYTKEEIIDEITTPKRTELTSKPVKVESKVSVPKAGKGERTYKILKEEGLTDVQGTPVKIVDGVDTFVHKGTGGWIISESSSGRYIADSGSVNTKESAIKNARLKIKEVGEEKFKKLISENKLPQPKVETPIQIPKESGETLYHGTDQTFDSFDPKKIGSKTDDGMWGRGFYLSDKATAKNYGKNIMEVNVKLDNPFVINDFKSIKQAADYLDMSEDAFTMTNGVVRPKLAQSGQFSSHMMEKGHDGIILKRPNNLSNETVVFDPSKLSSQSTSPIQTEVDDIAEYVKNKSTKFREPTVGQTALIQEANKPVYKSSRELANINKENYRKYVENLSKAQEFSDEAKHNYGLRTKNSWYNDELYERATNAESLVDSLYSKKDRYIIRAINNANKFKEKPVVSLKEGAIYFKTPAGQVSFHSPLLNIENKRFIKKLEKKVEFIDDYKWSGVKDDSRSVIGFLEENMGNNVNIQKYLQGKKEFVKKLENEIQNKISNLERGLPNKKVVLGKLEEAKKRGLKTDEYYSLYDFDFGSYADDQKLYVDFLKRGSVAVDDAINIKRQRELAYIKENEFEFPKRISKEIKQLENFYGIKTKFQPTDTSNKSNQTISKSPSPKQTVKATPEIKAPKTTKPKKGESITAKKLNEVMPDEKVSKIAKSIEQKMKDSGLVDESEDITKATFEGKTVKGQSEKTAKIIADEKRMNRIINGEEELPSDITSSFFTKAVEDYALEGGNRELAERLARSEVVSRVSYSAQDLRMAAERDPDSFTVKIREIVQARREALKSRFKEGKTLSDARKTVKKEISEAIKKKATKPRTWANYIKELEC